MSARRTRIRCAGGVAIALAVVAAAAAAADSAEEPARRICIAIERLTAFAPRGEVYVELGSSCGEADFAREDPILAYLEVLVGDLPPVGQDVRVYQDQPRRRLTFVFRDLSLERDQVVLVRLVRFGEILGHQSIKVP